MERANHRAVRLTRRFRDREDELPTCAAGQQLLINRGHTIGYNMSTHPLGV